MKTFTSFFKRNSGKSLAVVLTLTSTFTIAQTITRNQILVNARPYIPYTFTAASTNIWASKNCSAVGNIITPSWVKVGSNNQHMPYCWGGFSTLPSFTSGLTAGKSAGDDDCTTSGDCCESCALGVDCSGFVSHAWGLTTKYSTTTLENISTAYTSPSLVQPGDIFDYAGSHTRLVDTNYNNGSFKIMESSANGWDVSYNTYTASQLTSYSPRWYVHVINNTVTPNYTSSVKSGCAGMTVNYTDASTSTGTITAYKWTFQGGSPATATTANPTVTYAKAGSYNVTEVVTSSTGVDSITNIAYINVIPTATLPLSETFQSSTFPPTGWTMNFPSPDDSAWELCTSSGYSSTQCMYFPANCGQVINITGERQQIYTPDFSFATVTNAELSFDVAYEPASTATYSDTLVVYYSTNCGNSWTQIYSKGGMTLCTTGGTTDGKTDVNSAGCFVPTAGTSTWRRDSVSLAALNGVSGVMFSFEMRSGWGNILYLDNIDINTPSPTSVQNITNNADVKVYPNPSNGIFNLSIVNYELGMKYHIAIFNVLGQQVLSQPATNNSQLTIDLAGHAAGMYFYRLTTDEGKLLSEGKMVLEK